MRMEKYDPYKFYDGDSTLVHRAGYDTMPLITIEVNCEAPLNRFYILPQNRILFGADSYEFYLRKE